MKTRSLFLTLSLLGNAVLAGAFLIRSATPAGRPTAARSAPAASTEAASIAPVAGDATAVTVTPIKADFAWAAIDTDDLDELARRLKAAGFTSREIRAILSQKISQMTAGPSASAKQPTPYWRNPWSQRADPKTAEEARKRMAEQARLYQKFLMGPEAIADDPDRLELARRQWGDLPVEKLQAIATIDADYREMSMQQSAERRARPGEAVGRDAARLLQEERMADIAKVLTPEEFAVFELRNSPTATVLRSQLETFKPTEEEYKALFTIYKAHEIQGRDSQLGRDARRAITEEIMAEVKAVLGEDRALDYDAAVNQNSRDQTAGLVSRLGLPARVATEVRQTQQDFTQRAAELRANASLSPADRSAQLDALARQAETQLTAKLGADGFEAYSDLKGEWIRNLRSTSTTGGSQR